jgi:hypothetical protein
MHVLLRHCLPCLFPLLAVLPPASAASNADAAIAVAGTSFTLGGKPFSYTGISFFNAIYNPEFNRSTELRRQWLRKFQRYGINVLRVWAQWDARHGFVDSGPDRTLYHPDGTLRAEPVRTLRSLLEDAAALDMVIQLALFSHESWSSGIRLEGEIGERAVAAIARALQPHRNVVFQVWNESSVRVLEHVATIRAVDPERLVTNSPGISGFLGDPPHNQALDFLTPHTSRQKAGRPWEIAPREIAYLIARYGKPVVDDEPARNGTARFGGPTAGMSTSPYDHILQIARVWDAGGHVTYHHDMFQTGYNSAAVPPSGIPDPEFNPYHRQVLEFIALRDRYQGGNPHLRPLPAVN